MNQAFTLSAMLAHPLSRELQTMSENREPTRHREHEVEADMITRADLGHTRLTLPSKLLDPSLELGE